MHKPRWRIIYIQVDQNQKLTYHHPAINLRLLPSHNVSERKVVALDRAVPIMPRCFCLLCRPLYALSQGFYFRLSIRHPCASFMLCVCLVFGFRWHLTAERGRGGRRKDMGNDVQQDLRSSSFFLLLK